MADQTRIEWCDSTFNPVVGCTKISAACDGCYAEAWAKRAGRSELWNGERARTSASNWRGPVKWNAASPEFVREHGRRQRVFCASLADVFDNQWDPRWRADLWTLIRATPHLDWLLLTKRPQNIRKMLPPDWCDGYPNVWLGVTAEDQDAYDSRYRKVLQFIPAVVRFISYEPALGPLNVVHPGDVHPDQVIAGGESGGDARAADPRWFRDVRDQCAPVGIAFLFKQWGEHDATMARVGKKRAGRLLDGVQHDGYPVARLAA